MSTPRHGAVSSALLVVAIGVVMPAGLIISLLAMNLCFYEAISRAPIGIGTVAEKAGF